LKISRRILYTPQIIDPTRLRETAQRQRLADALPNPDDSNPCEIS